MQAPHSGVVITSITSTVTTTATTAATGSISAITSGRSPLVGETEGVEVGVFTGDRITGSVVTSQFDSAGGGFEVVVNPDPVSFTIATVAVGILVFLMMLREVVLAWLDQEALNPLRRSLNLRLRSLLLATRAPISSLLAIFLVLLADGVLKNL